MYFKNSIFDIVRDRSIKTWTYFYLSPPASTMMAKQSTSHLKSIGNEDLRVTKQKQENEIIKNS